MKIVYYVLQRICAVAQLCLFFIRQVHIDLPAHSVRADEIQRAETYVVDAVFPMHHSGHRHRSVESGKEALAYVAYRNGHRVERCALACNDAAAGLSDILLYLGKVERRGLDPGSRDVVVAFGDRHI